jgi:hypothetical protein
VDPNHTGWCGDVVTSRYPLGICESTVFFRISASGRTSLIVDFGIRWIRSESTLSISLLQPDWIGQYYGELQQYVGQNSAGPQPHVTCLSYIWKLTTNMENETLLMECCLDDKVMCSYSQHVYNLSNYHLYGKAVDCTLSLSE